MFFGNVGGIKNDYFTEILNNFGDEIRKLFIKKYGDNSDYTAEVQSISFWISEIIDYSTTAEFQKMLGSLSHDKTGDKAVQRLNRNLTNIDYMFHDPTNFEQIGYFYSIFNNHELGFSKNSYDINETALLKNIESNSREDFDIIFEGKHRSYMRNLIKKMTDGQKNIFLKKYHIHSIEDFLQNLSEDPLTTQLNELNQKARQIKELLVSYNEQVYNLKRKLVSLKHKKSFIFYAYNIRLLLPFSSERVGTHKKSRDIDLISKCFRFIENKKYLSNKINRNKKRYILENLPKNFNKCDYKTSCKDNCLCPLIEGFKKCLNPPECKNCGQRQVISEKYAHFDSQFKGYEFCEDTDFCLSLVGLKPEVRKKRKNKKKITKKSSKKIRTKSSYLSQGS